MVPEEQDDSLLGLPDDPPLLPSPDLREQRSFQPIRYAESLSLQDGVCVSQDMSKARHSLSR